MTNDEEDVECQNFIRAYPIPNGTASTMWCSVKAK
jgi:hypothetical protein